MSFETNIHDLATRMSTEVKGLRTLINGNAADLTSLTTTAKSNLVAAINELDAAVDGMVFSLDGLSDVVITTPATGHVLRHNGVNWVNQLGTTYYEVAGAAASAQSAAIAASQPVDTDLTAIAALATTTYGRAILTLTNQAALMGLLVAATESTSGIVELATAAESITGTDAARAIHPAGLAAVFSDRIDTNVALGASNTKVPSQAAVKAYADGLINAQNAFVYKGVIDASLNPNYPAADAGHTYRISVGGKIGGAAGLNVEPGDQLLAIVDGSPAGTQAVVGVNWNITQANVDGAVVGPATSVSGNVTVFSGTSGKVVSDSGFAVDNATVATGSATKIPTQAAVKTYADTKQPLDTDLTALAALVSAANKFPYATGVGTWALADVSVFGRSLLATADAAGARTLIDVYSKAEIGSLTANFVATFNAGLV